MRSIVLFGKSGSSGVCAALHPWIPDQVRKDEVGGRSTGVFSEELDENVGLRAGIRPLAYTARAIPSRRYHGFRVPGGEGVHVGEDELFGAVFAELLLVLPTDYREGVEYVARVVSRQAVQVEVQRVKLGAQVTALLPKRFEPETLEHGVTPNQLMGIAPVSPAVIPYG